ncbi:MAG: MmcQ/YjbR family DNA-binding protein [Telmatospirillum sp.]|nr:MmcQ/YjbR family DNA-binding protein [Telmatospirillum sp.]
MSEVFRRRALFFPHAVEQNHFGAAAFRVEGRTFAQLSRDGATGLVKLPLGRQAWLMSEYADACEVEPHWGRHGWTRLWLDRMPEALSCDLLGISWRLGASRGLHAVLDRRPPDRDLAGQMSVSP